MVVVHLNKSVRGQIANFSFLDFISVYVFKSRCPHKEQCSIHHKMLIYQIKLQCQGILQVQVNTFCAIGSDITHMFEVYIKQETTV